VAVGGAVLCALAGSAGPVAVVAAAVLTGVAAVAAAQLRLGRRSWDPTVTAAIALLIGVGAASPAIVRGDEGALPALVFLTVVLAVEAATFVVGSGASSRWEGPVAGVATALSLSLAVAAVFVPPFRGASPWILGLVVAAGVPLGAMAGTALLGRDEAPVPALRRLDALLVVGPVWAVVARLVLDL
jgi:hypothetical protein